MRPVAASRVALNPNQTIRLSQSAAQLLFGVGALALVTLLCFQLGLNLTTAAFAYLIAIVLLSLMGGFPSSAVLSIVAVGCLSYFFAAPVFNLVLPAFVWVRSLPLGAWWTVRRCLVTLTA